MNQPYDPYQQNLYQNQPPQQGYPPQQYPSQQPMNQQYPQQQGAPQGYVQPYQQQPYGPTPQVYPHNEAPYQGHNQYPQQNYGQQPMIQANQLPYQPIPPMIPLQAAGGTNCFDFFAGQAGFLIKQKFMAMEVVTGCDFKNVYKVHSLDQNGKKIKGMKAMFKAKEKSETCQRICLTADCREYKIKVANYGVKNYQKLRHSETLNDEGRQIFLLDRKYACTFLCCKRPKLDLFYVENHSNVHLGTIINPFYFCNYGCEIYNNQMQLRYRIEASCCQTYFWFPLPCKSCQHVDFQVFDAQGQVVTTLAKEGKDCLKNALSDVDQFRCLFPSGATKEDKALLFAATLMLDYSYFEDKHTWDSDSAFDGF
ncbi:hypothetical protein pb186bvf_020173 [Paramecium bursaria]